MRVKLFLVLSLVVLRTSAQESKLPYYEIPDAADAYTAGAIVSRMVDGLGFRYHWATEGLRKEDLSYSPVNDARTTLETIQHIHDLSLVIVNSVTNTPNRPGEKKPEMSFDEMRKSTLLNLQKASQILRVSSEKDFENFKLVFQRESSTRELPFWNQINGPIADALWHVGQVVSLRRQSGNPFTDKVSVLTGKVIK